MTMNGRFVIGVILRVPMQSPPLSAPMRKLLT